MRSQGIHTVLRKYVAFSEGKIRSQETPIQRYGNIWTFSKKNRRPIRAREIFSVLRKYVGKSGILDSSAYIVIRAT